jgi:hypothetical protein
VADSSAKRCKRWLKNFIVRDCPLRTEGRRRYRTFPWFVEGYEQLLGSSVNVTAQELRSENRTEVTALGMGFIHPIGELFYSSKY